jgi:hypothetical protein
MDLNSLSDLIVCVGVLLICSVGAADGRRPYQLSGDPEHQQLKAG